MCSNVFQGSEAKVIREPKNKFVSCILWVFITVRLGMQACELQRWGLAVAVLPSDIVDRRDYI